MFKYFSKVLNDYNVVFEDDSEDYLREEDINGVDVILLSISKNMPFRFFLKLKLMKMGHSAKNIEVQRRGCIPPR